jgi:hypothetical protein
LMSRSWSMATDIVRSFAGPACLIESNKMYAKVCSSNRN